jgi:hypothetical protein
MSLGFGGNHSDTQFGMVTFPHCHTPPVSTLLGNVGTGVNTLSTWAAPFGPLTQMHANPGHTNCCNVFRG